MKVPSFDLPLDEIRRSLAGLRRPLSIAILRARNPFNVGAIIRVAHSFLAREILLIGTEPYYQRGSMGMERFENIVTVPSEAEFLARPRAPGQKLVVFEKEHAQVDLWRAELPRLRAAPAMAGSSGNITTSCSRSRPSSAPRT